MQEKEQSSRYGVKYQSGPVLVTLDYVAEMSRQVDTVTKNRFIELKAPVFGVPQSKIVLVDSYDDSTRDLNVRDLFFAR